MKLYRARRLTLQGLCCLDVQGDRALGTVRGFIDDSQETPEITTAAHRMVKETYTQRETIDGILTHHARNWNLNRLAMVDRNILRLSTSELLALKTPFKVVISEALKLAQEFSSAESPRFINGVLDAIAKEIAEETGQTF